MEQYIETTFVLTKDKKDVLLATSHEEIDNSITIHVAESYAGFAIYITQEQAEDLISKLQKAIVNLEVHKRILNKEV